MPAKRRDSPRFSAPNSQWPTRRPAGTRARCCVRRRPVAACGNDCSPKARAGVWPRMWKSSGAWSREAASSGQPNPSGLGFVYETRSRKPCRQAGRHLIRREQHKTITRGNPCRTRIPHHRTDLRALLHRSALRDAQPDSRSSEVMSNVALPDGRAFLFSLVLCDPNPDGLGYPKGAASRRV
jgi:hypothetical protein